MRVLMSAYACEPNKGSEPAVAWNLAREMAQYHDVWVLTRANNRQSINEWLAINEAPRLSFIFYDFPDFYLRFKGGLTGIQIYYYLWQIGVYFCAKRHHKAIKFDLIHHVTFVKYWAPSFLALLPVPFLWGPVGGGESTPRAFAREFSVYGRVYETVRSAARWLGQNDPFVRLTARRSRLSLAATKETAAQLYSLRARRVDILSQCGIGPQTPTGAVRSRPEGAARVFISIGNLLHLKGFHIGIRAFAQAGLAEAEYWIIGEGPERTRLSELAQSLGIQDRVHMWGQLSPHDTLDRLAQADVLVHPSLHESGGFVCLEAMAAGKPVVCFDRGGPGTIVVLEAGIKIPAHTPKQAVKDIAEAMVRLALDDTLCERMGKAGQEVVTREYTWKNKGLRMASFYDQAIGLEGDAPDQMRVLKAKSAQ